MMKKVHKLTVQQGRFMMERRKLPVQAIAVVQRGPDNFGVPQPVAVFQRGPDNFGVPQRAKQKP